MNKFILPSIAVIAIVIWAIIGITNGNKISDSKNIIVQNTSKYFVFNETEYDFGVVKQSGGTVDYSFPFTYTGEETIKVTGTPTSCGCTTAEISTDILATGTEGIITVTFDPNLHAEPEGRFFKTVSLLTEPGLSEDIELKIWAEIDLDLGSDFFKQQEEHDGEIILESENLSPEKDYKTISAATLTEVLDDKHFFLVDVHVPEQKHIDGTDAIIPYNEISSYLDELPSDKDEAIVLYCRSGSMSQQSAQTLSDLGYTNVYHLEGGIQAYNKINQ